MNIENRIKKLETNIDFENMSDAELERLAGKPKADLSRVSTDDLIKMRNGDRELGQRLIAEGVITECK